MSLREVRRNRARIAFLFFFPARATGEERALLSVNTTKSAVSESLLLSLRARAHKSGSQVSILSTTHTTSDAMKRLGELAVQALPIVKMHPSNQLYEPQNFLAAGDLVDALVAKVDASPYFDVQGADQSRRCAALARLGREFAQSRLDTIPSRFDGTVIFENQCDKNLAETINDCFLISPKAKPGDGELLQAVHRFAVQTQDTNKITEIVCQSDLVMYLHTNRSLIFPEFMGASLADLGLGRSALSRRVEGGGITSKKTASEQKPLSTYGIVSVTPSTSCIDAFRVMRNNSVSAVAIVSEKDGKLLGAFSETDISYFADPDFAMALGLSVSQFLFLRHNALPKITHGVFAGADAFDAALQNPLYDSWRVYCKLEDKLEDVLELMSTGAVHRIWVVDDDRKPIGCVSLVDILALFQHWESPEQQLGKKKEDESMPQFEKTTEKELKERVVATAPAGQATSADEQMQE